MDFAALPPEINSGRMYAGAGPGPLLAAAAAWDDLASELGSNASSYQSVISGLGSSWQGPSSTSMAAAAAPYVSWMTATAAQAEETANQARAAVASYEAAFAATVPPPVIVANRTLLMTLIATNILGQNTPAIAATEAHYMEMWAQDAAAMYGYAGSSAAATQLTPFTEPPQTTNAAAEPMQAAAATQASTSTASNIGTELTQFIDSLPTALQSLANGLLESPTTSTNLLSGLSLPQLFSATLPPGLSTDLTNWNTIFSTFASGPYSLQGLTSIPGGPFLSFGQAYAWGQNGQSAAAFLAGPKPITGALAPLASELGTPHLSAAFGTGPVSGSMGRAALVSGMSVPQGWTQAAPEIRTLAAALPMNLAEAAVPEASLASQGGIFSQMAASSLAGRAVAASATHSGSSAAGVGSFGGVVAEADPAAATIIVIPVLED
ncbi:PPE family protein [Mycobacterium sp.]|jgi:PPE-repeat protein|uniref:PPE family protein n=1 Tax=Mycobacterium sp. TaxID=1785 RepID=UPI002C1F3477|nr:PPE family protein [Mycobacterium sp.]HXB85354.1 PPE family protein [Mycobacterium sp.]